MGKGVGWAGYDTSVVRRSPPDLIPSRLTVLAPFARRVHASIAPKPHPSPYTPLGRTQRVWSLHCVPLHPLRCTYRVAIVYVCVLKFEFPPEVRTDLLSRRECATLCNCAVQVLFRHITRAMREVGGGLLADEQSEGWDGTMGGCWAPQFSFPPMTLNL
ncbi:hypothetical protein DFH09DRAFT_548775 [Mycena vulgaris]|nr:hypothetical protein DFH09DRAFT_548775 [Mycena vulgaris]